MAARDVLMPDVDAAEPAAAIPDKPTLPKAPKKPKEVKDAVENERRQKVYKALKAEHEKAMAAHKLQMAARAQAQQAARKRDGSDGARRVQHRRAGKAASMALGRPFVDVYAELNQLTQVFTTFKPRVACYEAHLDHQQLVAAEKELADAWMRLLGRRLPQSASVHVHGRRLPCGILFVHFSSGWIDSTAHGPDGTELQARTLVTASLYVGMCDGDGQPHGRGSRLSECGRPGSMSYVGYLEDGEWQHGVFSGDGSRRQYVEDGSIEYHCIGKWQRGLLTSGTVTYLPEGDSYKGEFSSRYQLTGGIERDAEGHRLTTELWELKRHGNGKYCDPNGKVIFDGPWENDWPQCEWTEPSPGVWTPRDDGLGSSYVVDAGAPTHDLTAEQRALGERIIELQCLPITVDLYCAAQTHADE